MNDVDKNYSENKFIDKLIWKFVIITIKINGTSKTFIFRPQTTNLKNIF